MEAENKYLHCSCLIEIMQVEIVTKCSWARVLYSRFKFYQTSKTVSFVKNVLASRQNSV